LTRATLSENQVFYRTYVINVSRFYPAKTFYFDSGITNVL